MAGGALFVVSAGLGLVAAERAVPAYGLTIADRGEDSVARRVAGRFDPGAWWAAVAAGPYATPLARLFAASPDRPVLAALTRPYARMIAPALEALPRGASARLRVFGWDLGDVLPPRLAAQVMPYDERLQALLPGTRADFPHRALDHFARGGLRDRPGADAAGHRRWVEAALAGLPVPERPRRPRLGDDEIGKFIERHLPRTRAVGRLLRLLRDEEGVACEQARFTRLWRAALERRAA